MDTAAEEERQMLPLYSLLPPEIRRKIKALKKLQYQNTQLEAKYFIEVHKLECKFAAMNSELFSKRQKIIQGAIEPTAEDCDFNDGTESPDESDPTLQDLRRRVMETKNLDPDVKGIPEFWLTVLKNAGKTFDLVQPHDEPILRYLCDIKVNLNPEPMGFSLMFKFASNPYFNNKILVKEYDMRCAIDEAQPWSFDGPEIVKAKGTKIDWNEGMDVTRKTKPQNKEKTKTMDTKDQVKAESFFNFFSPPEVPDCMGEDVNCALAEDYALGIFMRERLVPNAVLYFTGDAVESDSSSGDDDSETSESCDSEEYNPEIGEVVTSVAGEKRDSTEEEEKD